MYNIFRNRLYPGSSNIPNPFRWTRLKEAADTLLNHEKGITGTTSRFSDNTPFSSNLSVWLVIDRLSGTFCLRKLQFL